jgi:uncharacterized membrane protein YuzA (DUF378 family)
MAGNKKGLHMVTFILLIIGGLNWLLVGLFGWDVGELFGGQTGVVSRIIYVLVGLAAIYELAMHKGSCCCCGKCSCDDKGGSMANKPSEPMDKPGGGDMSGDGSGSQGEGQAM